jgi:ATP-dependent helicase/nuclease subunit A
MNPQNPYGSCVLSASAGSGKTYQLCRRFLHLVAAGSDPAEIVTVTFTVKAAREMRSRILGEAATLLACAESQKEFARQSQEFYRWGSSFWQEQGVKSLRPPCSPHDTARKILAASQQLKITTTDSLFKDWVEKFPFEAGLYPENSPGAQELVLADSWEEEEFHRRAWARLFRSAGLRRKVLAAWQTVAQHEAELGLLDLETRIIELYRYHTHIWQLGANAFKAHPLLLPEAVADLSLAFLVHELADELAVIIRGTSKEQCYGEAIAAGDLVRLQNEGLLTKSYEVSKVILKGKKREERAHEISYVEERLRLVIEHQQLVRLNRSGRALFSLYQLWYGERGAEKQEQGKIEFADLAMGSVRLLRCGGSFGETSQDDDGGAAWQIGRRITHLLIDEMQDTSTLQWRIFSSLLEELLSGSSERLLTGVVPTAFVVGDKKQSIYGFREADPSLLERAGELFFRQGWQEVQLSASYRCAQVILDFVNKLFVGNFDPDFPLHTTAENSRGEAVVPNIGEVFFFCLSADVAEDGDNNEEDKGEDGKNHAQQQEAARVADFLAKHCVGDEHPLQIYDKEQACSRRLSLKDCCVLYRTGTHVALLEAALAARKIPFRREEQKNFFARREIADVLAFLRYLYCPEDVVALLTVLRSPMVGVSDGEMLEIVSEGQVEEVVRTRYAIFAELYEAASDVLPHELLWSIFTRFSALEAYRSAYAGLEGEIAAENLLKLLEIAISLEQAGHRQPREFLQELERLREQDTHGSAAAGGEVVSLMTIHKAKGLEFPLVAVMGLGDDWFRTDPYWLKDEDGMIYVGRKEQQPRSEDNPLYRAQELQKERLYAEAVRLLYVALTRAQHYLLLVGTEKKRRGSKSFLGLIQQTLF